ncbi:AraC family transcriptional regulator [Occultella aeris]|uniref:HTH-type transcriptional activator Btr n=1 Tax=Occultella aeris TaxID=2761496 RepID=A0A7M4DKY3_9MICO|nr:AraC family transcriptional regulator [Occultella aeris]VZO37873.1 HTH-type transcriptional activator Btr [Occultella aeris]
MRLPPPAAAISTDEAAAIDELLGRMRWSAGGIERLQLMPGHSRRVRGAGVRFVYVVTGTAVLPGLPVEVAAGSTSTTTGDVRVQPGDFVLLPRGGAYEVRTEPAASGASLVTGTLTLAAAPFERITDLMPAVLFSCGFRLAEPAYGGLLGMIDAELARARPGGPAVLDRLIDLVVSAALRAWLERGCASAQTWLTQLRDPQLRRALEAIHAEPGSPWTVTALARVANASRSQFAERFRISVGESPARYVTGVRMRRAEELLLADRPVSEIAFGLGYDSDEGFSRAFRRHSGSAPSDWRRSRRRAASDAVLTSA